MFSRRKTRATSLKDGKRKILFSYKEVHFFFFLSRGIFFEKKEKKKKKKGSSRPEKSG